MNKRKIIIGLVVMVVAGVVVTSLGVKLSKNNDRFFDGVPSDNKDECVTVTHSSKEDENQKGDEQEISENDQITENGTDKSEEVTDKNTDGNTGNSENNEDECVTVTQQKDESGADVTTDEIKNTEVNVVEMKEEVSAQITDYDAFVYAIKECFYKAGIMETEVTSLNKVTHDYNDNVIYFSMYVKSQTLKNFDVTYDLNKGNYYVLMD